MNKRSISIIGTGALGNVLARAAADAGYHVYSLFNRRESIANKLGKKMNAKCSGPFPEKIDDLGEIVFLTVPDNHLKETASKIADIGNDFDFKDRYFIHCSGTFSSEILLPLQEKGASVASFHPLQTFTVASVPADFNNIYVDMEGEGLVMPFLTNFARELGSRPFVIEPAAKPYLHAAAVTASNYLVALLECAGQIAGMGGLDKDEALRALMPLVEKSVENIKESDTLSDALSGPVARGDTATIADHLKVLEQNPRLAGLYKQMGHILVALSETAGTISTEQSQGMRTLLDE